MDRLILRTFRDNTALAHPFLFIIDVLFQFHFAFRSRSVLGPTTILCIDDNTVETFLEPVKADKNYACINEDWVGDAPYQKNDYLGDIECADNLLEANLRTHLLVKV